MQRTKAFYQKMGTRNEAAGEGKEASQWQQRWAGEGAACQWQWRWEAEGAACQWQLEGDGGGAEGAG